MPRPFRIGGLYGTTTDQRDRHSQNPRRKRFRHRAAALKRLYQDDFHCHYDYAAAELFYHTEMALRVRLQDRSRMVVLCWIRLSCTGDCVVYRSTSNGESIARKPDRVLEAGVNKITQRQGNHNGKENRPGKVA